MPFHYSFQTPVPDDSAREILPLNAQDFRQHLQNPEGSVVRHPTENLGLKAGRTFISVKICYWNDPENEGGEELEKMREIVSQQINGKTKQRSL